MSDKIFVSIDPDLRDLVPGFLENRRRDVGTLRTLLASGNFAAVRLIGHSMKGAGGGYGFDPITEYGGLIENAALAGDSSTVAQVVGQLEDYLARVQPVIK